jgi:Rrf2 family iron-sulfur cluster assembly transcriptional regulator
LSNWARACDAAALVRTFRGPGGGFRLAKPATGISVLDIVVSVERAAIAGRTKRGGGPRATRRPHVQYLRDQLEGFQYFLLQHMSLADVASGSLNRNPFLKRLFKRLRRRSRVETSSPPSHPPVSPVAGEW